MLLSPLVLHMVLATAPLLPPAAITRLGTPTRGLIQGYALAFSHDDKYLAEATHPPALWVWDVAAGRRVQALSTGNKAVGALAFGDHHRLVAGLLVDPSTGRISVFDALSGQRVRSFDVPGGHPVAIATDGKWAVFAHSDYKTGTAEYFMSLWDVTTGKHVRDIGRPYLARHARFSSDGKMLTVATYQNGIRTYEVASGKEVGVFREADKSQSLVHWPVLAPNGKQALLHSNPARLADLSKSAADVALCQHAGSFRQVTFSDDAELLAAGSYDGSIRRWNVRERTELSPLLDEHLYLTTLAFSRTGRLLAAANGPRTPRVWDLRTGLLLRGFDGHLKRIGELVFSPDSKTVASYSEESHRVFLWDLAARKTRCSLGELGTTYSHVRFSTDGKLLAACANRHKSVIIWDMQTGQERLRLPAHPRWIAAFQFLPDCKTMVTAAGDGVLRWFDLASGKELRQVRGFAIRSNRTSMLIQHIPNGELTGPMHGFTSFAPDGKRFASVTLDGGMWEFGNATAWLRGGKYVLRLWDTQAGKVLYQQELGGQDFPRFTRDGSRLLISGHALNVLDPITGKNLVRLGPLPPSTHQVELAPNAQWVLSSRHHAPKGGVAAQIGNLKTGVMQQLPDAGQGLVTATTIAPNGKFLATGGEDGTIVVWDAERLVARMGQK